MQPGLEKNKALVEANRIMNEEIANTLWFSYRSGWKYCLPETNLNGDVSWGCMVRCGQMLLAKTIQRLEGDSENVNKQLLSQFADEGQPQTSPFSLFALVSHAHKTFDVKPGDWFRATTIMMSLSDLNTKYAPMLSKKLSIYTSVDSLIEPRDLVSQVFTQPFEYTDPMKALLVSTLGEKSAFVCGCKDRTKQTPGQFQTRS